MKKQLQKNNIPNTGLELEFLNKGYKYIIGIDEAGRGPWAGPISFSAYIFTKNTKTINGINDSKKINEKTRNNLFQLIDKSDYFNVLIPSHTIDNKGLCTVITLSINTLISNIKKKIDITYDNTIFLIDGNYKLNIEYNYLSIIKGDSKHYSISIASIISKVIRDNYMINIDSKYKEYDFKTNKGYGTLKHIESINKYGLTKEHRKSFKPIKNFLMKSTTKIS